MPRLLRDAPLNGDLGGLGQRDRLDVLRALAREPEGLPAFLAECELARGGNARLDAHLDALPPARRRSRSGRAVAGAARGRGPRARFQASLLVRHAPPAVADAFCAGRLGDGGRVFGTLPRGGRRRGDRGARADGLNLLVGLPGPSMTLRDLLGTGPDVEVAGLAYDNRAVVPGSLFFCVPGFTRDGHDFVPDAVARGAAAGHRAAARARRARSWSRPGARRWRVAAAPSTVIRPPR